jgi:rRNA-processing protein FCF1
MRKIIVDTNFLLIPIKFSVDIFSEFERICHFNFALFVFKPTIDELNGIIRKASGKDKRAAKFGLRLIKLKNIHIIDPGNKAKAEVDELILKSVRKEDIVATLDLELKRKLLEKLHDTLSDPAFLQQAFQRGPFGLVLPF